ncbi:hypothetical protein C5E11_04030 [Clavibacter michiganensis]|nr:hypothetical protein C5E11_04030 [Clavibacter michiganensis]
MQALHHLGYDVESLAHALLWTPDVVERVLTVPPETILAVSHKRVIDLFKQRRAIPAEIGTDRTTAAKSRADENSWAGPFDWDDIDTDDRPHARRKTHAGDHIEPGPDEVLDAIDIITAPAPVAPLAPVKEEPEPVADEHDTMTDREKRTHYSAGCRAQTCRDAVAAAARERAAKRKADAAVQGRGEQGKTEPERSAVDITPATTEPAVEAGQHEKTIEELRRTLDQKNAALAINDAALTDMTAERDNARAQFNNLTRDLANAQRSEEAAMAEAARLEETIADELDLRATLQSQLINVTKERDAALAAVKYAPVFSVPEQPTSGPNVTVHVYIGGDQVA